MMDKFTPFELLNMTSEDFHTANAMGVTAYREVQRSLRDAGVCACARCTTGTWQRAQSQMAKLANMEAQQHGDV